MKKVYCEVCGREATKDYVEKVWMHNSKNAIKLKVCSFCQEMMGINKKDDEK